MLTGSGLYTARVRNESLCGGKIETVELEIDIQNAPRGFVKLDIAVKVLDGRGAFSH